jgi:hypothetical protein
MLPAMVSGMMNVAYGSSCARCRCFRPCALLLHCFYVLAVGKRSECITWGAHCRHVVPLQLSVLLSRADPELHQQLKALQAADCFFAYRMVVVLMLRDLPTAQVPCDACWQLN